MKITNARLLNIDDDRYVLRGNIYDDEKGRFADGTLVQTSRVVDRGTDPVTGKNFAQTKNSLYEVEYAPEETKNV